MFLQEKINVSLFNISVWNISKGHIRITDTSSFFGIITCYLWAQILNRRKILSNLIKLVVILSGFVYVDRSRMPLYSAILCIVFMALLYHKETISKVVSWIGVVAVSLIVLMLGIYKDILMQFSADNNGLSTLARINELEYYFLAFWDKFPRCVP